MARYYLSEAMRLPPLEFAPEGFDAEVHMMIGRCDLPRALSTLHTFCHHSGLARRLGITFHLDGTVRKGDIARIERRVHGARFTDYPAAEEALDPVFQERPCCRQNYYRDISCMPKLFHVAAFARSDRTILLDSDVVFWGRPTEMVDWVDNPGAPPRYLISGPPDHIPSTEGAQAFTDLCDCLAARHGSLQIRHYFFNSGLLMFDVKRMSFDLIEDYFRWQSQSKWRERPDLFWFSDWTAEQTAYMLNFMTWPDAEAFGPKYVCGGGPAEVCTHFMAGSFYRKPSLIMIARELERVAAENRERVATP